jgi:biotin carboxyl carrier protein
MRKFIVNVNGNSYEVEVEEVGGVASVQPAVPQAAKQAAAPSPAPVQQKAPEAAAEAPAPKVQGTEGSGKMVAPMPGTILDVKVNAGDTVKKGDLVMILEAMKMENELLAPQDAVIASVNVTKGQQVNSGDLLFTYN